MTKHYDENVDLSFNDTLKLILDNQDLNSRRNKGNINISPTIAFVTLIGVVVVFFQVFIGFGMWTIQDRMDRYDGYGDRIIKIEQNLVKFEDYNKTLHDLTAEFKAFTKEPKFTENDFNAKIADKLEPIKDQLDRIEDKIVEKSNKVQSDVNSIKLRDDDIEQRVRGLENELEVYKRLKTLEK